MKRRFPIKLIFMTIGVVLAGTGSSSGSMCSRDDRAVAAKRG